MKITRETDHAIKCILYLSHCPDKYVPVAEIATKNVIPRSFLAKILQKLSKLGVVESLQGNHGGFRLTRSPEKINVFEIFEAIQGAMIINECVVDQQFCNRVKFCSIHPIWQEIKRDIEDKLTQTNFLMLSQQELQTRPQLLQQQED